MGFLFKSLRSKVFFPAITPFLFFCLVLVWNNENALLLLAKIQAYMLSSFDWFFLLIPMLMFILSVVVCFTPVANIRLGDKGEKPLFTKWEWFQISLCTTLATGFIFWGSAEPLYHLKSPIVESIKDESIKNVVSLSIVLFHWSFVPYAIYTVPSILIAISIHKYKNPATIAHVFSRLFGVSLTNKFLNFIDSICLFTLVSGFSATLGVGIMMVSGAAESLLGIAKSPGVYAIVCSLIVIFFVVSSVSGLKKGIKILSQINMKLMFILVLFLFVSGPTVYIFKTGVQAFFYSLWNIFDLGFVSSNQEQRLWSHKWTIYSWSLWLSWAPTSAIFLAKIAKGHTVRDMLKISFIYPSIFVCIWLSVLGGSSLYINSSTNGSLFNLLLNKGPDTISYEILNYFPIAIVTKWVLFVTVFLSFVTAADSTTEVMCDMSYVDSGSDGVRAKCCFKIFFGVFTGLLSWAMVTFFEIDGMRLLSNIGGFPIAFICILFILNMVVLFRKRKYVVVRRRLS